MPAAGRQRGASHRRHETGRTIWGLLLVVPADLRPARALDGLPLLPIIDLEERERRHLARQRLHHRQRARNGCCVTGE